MKIQLSTNSTSSYMLNFKQQKKQVQPNNANLATNSCSNTGIAYKNYALSSTLINKSLLQKQISFGAKDKHQEMSPEEQKERIEFLNELKNDEKIKNNGLYKNFAKDLDITTNQREFGVAKFVLSQDEEEIGNKIDFVLQCIYEDAKKLCGSEYYAKHIAENRINYLVLADKKLLLLASTIYDKETLAQIFEKGLYEVAKQKSTLENMSVDEIKLLIKMTNCHDEEGNKFRPEQKLDFAKYIVDNELNESDEFKTMVNSDSLKLKTFNIKLLQKTLNKLFFNDEEVAIEESKLLDLDYAGALNKSLYERDAGNIKKVLDLGFSNSFEEYIFDERNDIGRTNKITRRLFEEKNMDFNYWLHPSKEIERQFKAVDTNAERLSQISSGITENMNILLNSPAKKLVKKQFNKYIKEDKFVLPEHISNNKHEIEKLLNIIIDISPQGQLTQVWKRAFINKNSTDINLVKNATNTLTILDDLTTLLEEVSTVNETSGKKEYDVTIKMWDRNPLKDLFQGNYSTCCIGMGNANAPCMADYLMSSAFNMIELVDNKTNKIIGNSLCYFVKDENDKPALVLDNIEINNKEKPSTEVGIKLRKELFRYASSLAEKVTGDKDTQILLGKSSNDLPTRDLKGYKDEVKFLGEYVPNLMYLDAFKGFCTKADLHDDIFLYRCNSDM